MDYRIAICDDSAADRQYIADLVEDWARKRGHFVQMRQFVSAEAFSFAYAERKDYDMLLLDIEMGRMDGVSLARQIRKGNETVQIVFITGYSDYIAEGYEVSALHYLMKPVSEEKLHTVLDRAADKLRVNERALNLEIGGEMVRVWLHEIRYLEVRQNYVTIHAAQDYTVKRTLSEFAAELDERFFRIGRSFLVNLLRVQRVTKTEVYLTDGTVLPLPRGCYDKLNRAIIANT